MDNEKAIIIGLFAVIGVGVLFAGYILLQTFNAGTGVPLNRAAPGSTITTGTTGNGDVEISLTPQGVNNGNMMFGIALNTHSVDLSASDLRQMAVLEYNGKSVYASSAPQLGGHHLNGALAFPVQGSPGSYVVRINGIPQQQERVFAW